MGDSHDWNVRYQNHLKSAQWANMKRDLIRLRGNQCEHCKLNLKLQLHHKTYERLGRELTSDLELLCEPCHQKADQVRAAQGEARSANARYEAALDTYATKKYGEEWWYNDHEGISEEFDRWLERKNEDW